MYFCANICLRSDNLSTDNKLKGVNSDRPTCTGRNKYATYATIKKNHIKY